VGAARYASARQLIFARQNLECGNCDTDLRFRRELIENTATKPTYESPGLAAVIRTTSLAFAAGDVHCEN
jgi:hypothetical protein